MEWTQEDIALLSEAFLKGTEYEREARERAQNVPPPTEGRRIISPSEAGLGPKGVAPLAQKHRR